MIFQYAGSVTNYNPSWPQFYQRWLMINSALGMIFGLAFLFIPSPIPMLTVVTMFIISGLGVLLYGGRRIGPVIGISNIITSIRSITAVVLMVWLLTLELRAIDLTDYHFWIISITLVFAELSDLLDGFVARRIGPTEFGAVWDMENDVAFSYVLCLLGYFYVGIGPWILISTLIRHGYILVFRFQNDPPTCPSRFKWFAKTVCAFQLVALISLFVPILPMVAKVTMNGISIVTLVISFAWDFMLRRGTPRAV